MQGNFEYIFHEMADTLVMDLDATAAQQYFAIRTTPLVAAVILCGLVIVVLQVRCVFSGTGNIVMRA